MLRNLVICVMEVLISDTCWLGLVAENFDIYATNMRCSNVVLSKINAESPYQVPSPAVSEKSNMFFLWIEMEILKNHCCVRLQQCMGFSATKTTPYSRGTTVNYYFAKKALVNTSTIR